MNITFKLDVKNYIRFNYWYNRKLLLYSNIFYIIFLLFLLFPLFGHVSKDLAIFNLEIFAILILILVYFNASMYFKSKKVFESDSLIQREYTYSITSDALIESTERSNVTIKWDEIYSFTESKDAFYIFIGMIKAFIIPKRALDNAALQELRQLAIANLPPKKVRLRK